MTPENDPLAIALFSEVAMVDQLARSRLSRVLPKGMELSHFSVLNHLAHASSERTPAQLARLFHVTKGAMTNTLGKLEAVGYVHIRPDWNDARRKFISLSPAGLRAREEAVKAIAPLFDEVVAATGSGRIKSTLPFLRELRSRLESL